jgi:hypothetical protein
VVVSVTTRFTTVAVAIGSFLILIAVGHGQVVRRPLSEFKAIVFDETGAVIPDCEVVLRSDSESMVSHTGMDGSVTVRLPGGRYAVTTTKVGFVTSKIPDVQIDGSMSDTLRFVLKVDSTRTDGGEFYGVPTATSELPSVIRPEPSRAPSANTEVLSVCELLANAKNYAGETVTLNATLAGNEEFWAFTYDSCQPMPTKVDGTHPLIAPSFNNSRYEFNSRMTKKLNKLLRKQQQANVTVIGVFADPGHYFGHQLCCRYQLDVLELVSVEQVKVSRIRWHHVQ